MDWMRYKLLYFILSGFLIIVGIYSISRFGFKLGVDFAGGSIIEYKFNQDVSADELVRSLQENGVEISSIQELGEGKYLFRFPPLTTEIKEKVNSHLVQTYKEDGFEELRFETVGPTIGPELIKKTIYAILIAASAILVWVALQFKSLKFGTSAILAMIHDSFILIGSFSLFGKIWGAEVDFLFVTALLTTLSFSVHDTIVVYDRIREFQRKVGGSLTEIANRAVTETMVRSLNNSFTIIFMLLALILLGGTTIKWFAISLLVGTVLGTYSSPFVAVPLLVAWDDVVSKMKRG